MFFAEKARESILSVSTSPVPTHELSVLTRVRSAPRMTVAGGESVRGQANAEIEPGAMQRLRDNWRNRNTPIADFLSYLTEYQGNAVFGMPRRCRACCHKQFYD